MMVEDDYQSRYKADKKAEIVCFYRLSFCLMVVVLVSLHWENTISIHFLQRTVETRKNIDINEGCNKSDWPRSPSWRIPGMGIGDHAPGNVYDNLVEFRFDGQGIKRGIWLEWYISHGGAAATERTVFRLQSKSRVGLTSVEGPCDPRSFGESELIETRGCKNNNTHFTCGYEIWGMGGWSGWAFAYVQDENKTVNEIISYETGL